MITRTEHLQWCKERALQYLDGGCPLDAVASMGSDLTKHPETAAEPLRLANGVLLARAGDSGAVRRWIESFA